MLYVDVFIDLYYHGHCLGSKSMYKLGL